MKIQKVAVVGAGVHFRERYYSVLENNNISIELLIDLERSRDSIFRFFFDKKLKPNYYHFISSEDEEIFGQSHVDWIFSLYAFLDFQALLISTEPSVRQPYLMWALQKDIDIFLDKPVLAFRNISEISFFKKSCCEIFDLSKSSQSNVVVSCERRSHAGYQFVFEYLRKLMSLERLKLTSIDIDFGGGIWKLEEEFLHDCNHPFYFGYGMLLHSGYHYIDLLEQFLSLSEANYEQDEFHWIANFPQIQSSEVKFGESDFYLLGQASSVENFKTTYTIKLVGNSLSLRTKFSQQERLQGKVRQERVTLHFGHLVSVHVQSLPYNKLEKKDGSIEDFNITIFHHPSIFDTAPVLQLNRKFFSDQDPNLSQGESMNVYARKQQLVEFLKGNTGNSTLLSHRKTMMRLCNIYEEISKRRLRNHDSNMFNISK